MIFNENDIEELLYSSQSAPHGSYNHLQWTINPGKDVTDVVARITSIHEFFHNELNSISCYGFLLQGYAFLSREKSSKSGYYRDILNFLVGKCRTAHEAYATWLSITVFRTGLDDRLPETILNGNEQYFVFFNKAESLVKDVNSIFLKQQIVTASIRICFQSLDLANLVGENLEEPEFSRIKSIEFPNDRFQYLLDKLPRNFIQECILGYIETVRSEFESQLLHEAFSGNENTHALMAMENNHLAIGMSNYTYAQLKYHFELMGCPSFNETDHLDYFQKLLPQLDSICPFSKSKNPLFLNSTPFDYERSTLLSFESETLIFNNPTLFCIVLRPDELSEATRNQILQGVGLEPHLYIVGRYSIFLKDQYTFKYKNDKEWFNTHNKPFTAIRYAGNINGERIVFYIPFDHPDQLTVFLQARKPDLPLLGCVSVTAAYNSEWLELWGDFFSDYCPSSCLLMDISPLHYIENVFPNEQNVSYCKVEINAGETINTAIIFRVQENDEIKAVMVAPCSDICCQIMHYYIKLKYPSLINDKFMIDEQFKDIPVVLSHIFREESTFYFHSEKTNYI